MSEQPYKNNEIVAVIGLGYVGLPLALLADRKGYKVIGIDINPQKIGLIANKVVPFVDEKITNIIKESKMEATTDFSKVSSASIIVICVPTPVYEDRTPNLEPVIGSCAEVSKYLKEGQLVILESTVNPGVCEEIAIPLLEKGSNLKCGKDFYLAHCPERINPGDKDYDVSNIARVVGASDEIGLKKAVDFYESIISAKIKPMKTLKEAEAVKIVENCFRDVNIAFVNELAMSFSKLGIDIKNVIEGASTKPYSFMAHFPGCGVGGHCIAVDPYYLIEYAKNHSAFEHKFLSLARSINNGMPKFTVDTLIKALKENDINVRDAKVSVLGLAYKGDIDDCRESPAYEVIKELKEEGIEPVIFDPFVIGESSVKTLDEALKGADAVLITTNHSVFKKLSSSDFIANEVKIVIDGRNCLNKEDLIEAGIYYRGIGR